MESKDDLRSEIGKALQWLRKNLALTQYQLAALAHLDYRHYQNIETGRVEVKVETLKRICDALGLELSAFFAIKDRKPWLFEKLGRTRGGGELYVFHIEYEHSSFRMLDEVRQLLTGFGRDLAEGQHDRLHDTDFGCAEVDANGRCLWKNQAAASFRNLQVGHTIGELFPNDDTFEQFMGSFRRLLQLETLTFYQEIPVRFEPKGALSLHALIGLRSLVKRELQSLFIAFANINHLTLPGQSLQVQLPSSVTPLIQFCHECPKQAEMVGGLPSRS